MILGVCRGSFKVVNSNEWKMGTETGRTFQGLQWIITRHLFFPMPQVWQVQKDSDGVASLSEKKSLVCCHVSVNKSNLQSERRSWTRCPLPVSGCLIHQRWCWCYWVWLWSYLIKLGGQHPGWCYGKYDELQTRWTSLGECCHGLNFVQIAAAGELAAWKKMRKIQDRITLKYSFVVVVQQL